ncbi:hypothetical protein BJX76DRAFT_319830 [Aspergillus varians]
MPQQEQPNLTAPTAPTAAAPAATIATIPNTEAPEMMVEASDVGVVRFRDQLEGDRIDVPPRSKSGRGRPRDGVYTFEPTELESVTLTPATGAVRPDMNYNSPQTTSYWSVPEVRDFPSLLAHFGRDFEGISNFMKTKSTQMVKNYFQRQLDSGKKDFEDLVTDAETKKARGEPPTALPIPNFTSKRRYEATPSAVSMSRPLAPHTEATPEIEDSRLAPTARHGALSSQPVSLHARPLHEREPSISRYPPLAQASSAPMAPHSPAMALTEETSRGIHAQSGLPSRMQGPRLGFFPDDRRDPPPTVLSRPHDHSISSRQAAASGPEITRMEPLHSQGFRAAGMDVHGSPLLPGQSVPPHQPYLQSLAQPHAQPPSLMSHGSHSRQPSLTKPPGSPSQGLGRHEPEMSHIRRDSIGQRSFYPLSASHVGMSQPPPVMSPSKEPLLTALTPVETPEPPRQVPAKRSNIMSILNDEPEEPQPRKRFASDQASSIPSATANSPSRPVYTGGSSIAQPSSRQEESILTVSHQKGSAYPHQNQYLPLSRPYSDYSSYNPGPSGTSGNTDWLGRFDPRAQPSSAPPPPGSRPPTTLTPQPPYSPFAPSQTPSSQMLPNLNAPSPAPTPPPVQASQRPTYPGSVYAPSPAPHTQSAGGSRDIPSQGPLYRSTISSPTPRNGHISYSSRPGLSSTSSYGSTAQTVPVSTHMPGTPQQHPSGLPGYHHVQPMVSHQPQPHRSHLGLAGVNYGRNTPPPQAQSSRMAPLAGTASQQIGRSYTPPTVMQPNPTGGMTYAPSGHGNPHPLQARAPGPGAMNELVPGPHGGSAHHRVYSQGSNNPFPGSLPSQHPTR